ncbi:MAG: hypothetical protein EAZ92_09200 [Candidatus Kapaibacterium sp.]|jgi:hypothetical protein|nr:MAG: hypothetical protein EAZ92_09200 [Candidatus Kapabacteria bacterium]
MAKLGRKPRSEDGSVRVVTVRLTEEEYARLLKESDEAGVGVSQLMRSRSLDTPETIAQKYQELKEAVAMVLAKF